MPELSDPPVTLTDGVWSYLATDWGDLPPGFSLGDIGGIAVDANDQVYVFNRSAHPMLVFERSGRFVRSWGEGLFTRPHGIHIDAAGHIWCTDDGDHSVRQCTPEGRVLLTIGIPGKPAPVMSGLPFHRCTHTATAPTGELYVSDGYCNARVHKYSPDGKLLKSWGEPGIDPGQFNVPHNLVCDADGWVYVADRENHRVQVFDGEGRYQTSWQHLHRPCALCAAHPAQRGAPLYYVGEAPPGLRVSRPFPNLGARVSIVDAQGRILARIGAATPGHSLAQFIAPHGMAVDSHGDIYVGEVAAAGWSGISDEPMPSPLRRLRKLVKQSAPATF